MKLSPTDDSFLQQKLDPLEHVYVFDSESDMLVPQLMGQIDMQHELHNDLVYDCTDNLIIM